MRTTHVLILVAAAISNFAERAHADPAAELVVAEQHLSPGRRILVTRRQTHYRPPSREQQRAKSRRLVPPGSELRAADREHEYRFFLVEDLGAEPTLAWSLKVQDFDDWPIEFRFIAAGTAEPGLLVIVYEEDSWVHVHAVDLRQARGEPLALPVRPAEAVKLGGIAAIRADRADVRGSAADGSLTVVISGLYVTGNGDEAYGTIARVALREGDGGLLRWSSAIETVGVSNTVRKQASPAEIRRLEAEREWDASDAIPLAGGGVLDVRRRRAFDPNPANVKYHYHCWLVPRDGARDDVPWFPAVADAAGHGDPLKVVHAARVKGGYLVVVFRRHDQVRARLVDLRAGGVGRPDLHGHEEAELLRVGEGVDVRSTSVAGSVADGTLTVRLRGTSPELDKDAEVELARATLAKAGGTYRWTVDNPPPPK